MICTEAESPAFFVFGRHGHISTRSGIKMTVKGVIPAERMDDMSPVRPNGGESLQDMIDRYNRELLKMSAAGGGQMPDSASRGQATAGNAEARRPRPEPDEPLYRPGGMMPRPEPDEPVEWSAADGWSEQEQGLADLEQARRDREQGLRDMEQAKIDREQGLRDIEQARTDREKGLRDIEQARMDREQGLRDEAQARRDREQGLHDMEQARADREQGLRDMGHSRNEPMPAAPRNEDDRWAQWLYDLEQGRRELEEGLRELEKGLREWQQGMEEYRRQRYGQIQPRNMMPYSSQPWPEDDHYGSGMGRPLMGVVPTQPVVPGRVTAQSVRSGQEGESGYGYLVVQVYTAERAEPVAGAQVTVTMPAGSGGKAVGTQTTDMSGKTGVFRLPVRGGEGTSPSYSAPSVNYNVYITADGYQPSGPLTAQIFEGIAGVLPVELIPGRGVRL